MQLITNFQRRDELGKADNQKEQVEEKFELIEQHNRNESYNVVFLISNLVGWVSPRYSSTIHVQCSFLCP